LQRPEVWPRERRVLVGKATLAMMRGRLRQRPADADAPGDDDEDREDEGNRAAATTAQ
jgi:hypothetical protein